MTDLTTKLQNLIDRKIDSKLIHGIVLNVTRGNGDNIFTGAAGNLSTDTQYFIASTTKIYVTALIMKLVSEQKISLTDKLAKFFPQELITNINNFKGQDRSSEITVKDLLAHTSGIPDYFMGKLSSGISLQDTITQGQDRSWTFAEAITMAKSINSNFAPGQKGKALYSDTNFQILGQIIEIVRGQPIKEVFENEIFQPLKMQQTYLYTDPSDTTPFPLYYKDKVLNIPQAMSSFKADGGIVSTVEESTKFIRAFTDGTIYPKHYLDEMTASYNRIFFPLQYGIGLMKFELPRIFTLFQKIPSLIGHSGLSGAFSYYCPDLDLYITGTVNQVASPASSYRMLIELVQILKRALA